MSEIYERLQQQQAVLQSVPVFGTTVSLDKPPSGEDLPEQIYLEPAIAMATDAGRTTVLVEWTALVAADPGVVLSRALDAQDAMLVALESSGCPIVAAGRISLGDRQPWARTLAATVTVTFTSSKLPGG